MAATYDLKHGANGEKYRFNLKAANGEVILISESYENKESALGGIESVRKHAVDEARFERTSSKRAEPYFVLKADYRDERDVFLGSRVRERHRICEEKRSRGTVARPHHALS